MSDLEDIMARGEASLARAGEEGAEVVRGRKPPLLHRDAILALAMPLLAAVTWALAIHREAEVGLSIEPLALILRVLALALSLRAVLAIHRYAKELAEGLLARESVMVLLEEGIYLRVGEHVDAAHRSDVLGVVERGDWRARSGFRWAPVLVTLKPRAGALTHWSIPPFFEDTPGLLAERLMRYAAPSITSAARGGEDEAAGSARDPLPSKTYEEAAAGRVAAGSVAIRHGWSWLEGVPIATVLLGIAMVDGLLRAPTDLALRVAPAAPPVLAICLLLFPLGWVLWMRRYVTPRKGLAMVMTPAAILMRTERGTLSVPWDTITRLRTDTRNAWSVLHGKHVERALLIERRTEGTIRYEESFLGAPVEVVVAVADAYRRRALP